jgi:hypothetical protein
MGKTLEQVRILFELEHHAIRTNAHACEHVRNILPATQFRFLAIQHHMYPIDGGSKSHYRSCIGGIVGRSTTALQLLHARQA